ncbi:hypothetical protein IWW48_005139 [Coemansia sp. RSA 1200]|nr:hypothetical protein IWW48_005139 [Coemansia sp. RSA 1200]
MAPGNVTTDARKKLAANLQVLRRYDSQIEAIIDTTSHVVLYQFQEQTQTWANKDVEGALFIYKRATAPHFGFTIMNRIGVENYTEYLGSEMAFQTSGQIVIYTSKSKGCIVGIWIYEETDRVRIPEQLGLCCKSAAGGQSPQRLYPKSAEEEGEFQRLYPRSRSNSRKVGGANSSYAGNASSAAMNHAHQQPQQMLAGTGAAAPIVDAVGMGDLVQKLRAIGIEPKARSNSQSAGAEMGAPASTAQVAVVAPDNPEFRGQYTNEQSSIVQPQLKAQTAGGLMNSQGVQAVFQTAAVSMQQPASPALHPAPSPFPPSTIATPLPEQGFPRSGLGAAYGQMWPAQVSSPAAPRSAHASPAPAAYGGMQAIPGMVLPAGMPPPSAGAPTAGASVAQNLAEQLVTLVRQRMNTLHTGATAGSAPAVARAQREYCREWLIRVIQMDDELVDAFVRRFPPPAPQQ